MLDVDADRLALLHHLELLVLQHGLPAGQRLQLVLQVGGLLGPDPGAGQQRVVPLGPGPDTVDVPLQPADVPVQITGRRLGLDQLVLGRAHRGLGRGQRGVLGQRAAPVGEPGQFGVDVGEIEQSLLDSGVGLHCVLPALGATVHGSVRRRDTRTSTLPPRAARTTSAACWHHGHSEAQCATSTSAGVGRVRQRPGQQVLRRPDGGAGRR